MSLGAGLSHPNILFVIVDDHRPDAIGALGHATVKTPVLDGLVRRGTTFARATIQGSLMPAVCAPSRACLLTGNGVFRADAEPKLDPGPVFEVQLPADACTLPERLRAAGYETFVTGKWHNDLPALLHWITGNIGIHHIHHLNSRIPYYRLPSVMRDFPELKSVGRLTIWDSIRNARLALWCERSQKMISFKGALSQ